MKGRPFASCAQDRRQRAGDLLATGEFSPAGSLTADNENKTMFWICRVLMTERGSQDESSFEKFPHEDVFMTK